MYDGDDDDDINGDGDDENDDDHADDDSERFEKGCCAGALFPRPFLFRLTKLTKPQTLNPESKTLNRLNPKP